GTAEVRGVGACRAVAEAGGPPDGRANCRGAARGAAMCGAVRGAAMCGAARGAAMCGAARGAAMCGAARGAAICGAGGGAGAACGAGAAGAGRAAGIPPPCLCCGCAAAVVAIVAETIKTVAMRVFHWNMTSPPTSSISLTPEMACWFRLRRGRGLHRAYMACDKFADHLLRIARPNDQPPLSGPGGMLV